MARFELVWALDHAAWFEHLRGHESTARRLAAEAVERGKNLVPAAARDAAELLRRR